MAAIQELLGTHVLNGKGEKVDVTDFSGKGKAIGLYFSAHWCPPCRNFTPVLGEFYSKFKATGRAGEMEIVFVSFDRDEAAFKEYFSSMPFLALDWANEEKKKELSAKFKVSGIPFFVIIDADTGALITTDGRGKVSGDPSGEAWPYK